MRLIDADAAIEAVCEEVMDRFFVPPSAGYNVAEEALKKLPSIQSKHKTGKTGQWIPSDSELEIKCNKCGKDFSEYVYSTDYIFLAEYPKFCPNCGAIMKKGEQE